MAAVPRALFILCLALAMGSPAAGKGAKTVTFPSEDGLEITADLYVAHSSAKAPFIVLFHQANFSRGEYHEIAPKLNKLGFNCMAVDQRSGKGVNGVNNETKARAEKKGSGTSYVDAMPDMIASLRYVRKNHGKGKVLGWGSSYSAALILKIAGDHPELMDGVLSFAPGEYFGRQGKSKTWVKDSASKIRCPVFITSAKREHGAWKGIFEAIPGKKKVNFLPKTEGQHGSRALWEKFDDHKNYWKAVNQFLANFSSRP